MTAHAIGSVQCSCADCRFDNSMWTPPSADQSPTAKLIGLFDAASQCRAMVHLNTTDQPQAVTALRDWCVAHRLGLRTLKSDGDRTYRVDLPNGGVIHVTEWR